MSTETKVHPHQKIEVLLCLISEVNGVADLNDADKKMRESNPERLVAILTQGYLQTCRIRNEEPTKKVSWLIPAIEEEAAEYENASKYL